MLLSNGCSGTNKIVDAFYGTQSTHGSDERSVCRNVEFLPDIQRRRFGRLLLNDSVMDDANAVLVVAFRNQPLTHGVGICQYTGGHSAHRPLCVEFAASEVD